MIVYRCSLGKETEPPVFVGTQTDAKAWLRGALTKVEGWERPYITVTECDVETDKRGVLAMLNGCPRMKAMRVYKVTPRGGMKEAEPEN